MMNWPALNDKLCGILIDFSLEEGLVLFLKKKMKKEVKDIMEVGNYLFIYLEEKSEDSESDPASILGRLKDLHWKSEEAIWREYGVSLGKWKKQIKSESTAVIESRGHEKAISIGLSGDLHCIGKIDFLGVPKKIPHTWMKVFEASEKDVREALKGTCEGTGFKVKIGPKRWVSVGFQGEHLTDNILIVGSYEDFLSLVIRQILKFTGLPKIVFTQEADTTFSDFDSISIREFQGLVSNGFGFEYCSDEQILNAATSLNPPQIRLLSNLLVQVRKEKKGESKFAILSGVIAKNKEAYNGRYTKDLVRIEDFLKSKWDEDKNLNNLIHDGKITVVDISQEGESKQIAFSKFLRAVVDEINNRKRSGAPFLEFLLLIEDIEDYVPSNSEREMGSDKTISKETFRRFVAHPNTNGIGLIMSTRFPSRIDPLIYYLCPNRVFGEVFERRELMKIKEIFGIEEMEIRNLRNIPTKGDEWGILLNFPSRFCVDAVDGILTEGR